MGAKDTIKKAVVTGAAGFAGYSLTSHLLQHGYEVYAVIRPGSSHNDRLEADKIAMALHGDCELGSVQGNVIEKDLILKRIHIIELDASQFDKLPQEIETDCDIFFHLAWAGGRDAFDEQMVNIEQSIKAVEAASALHCSRFISTGSQAEYGAQDCIIHEDIRPEPINAYGAAKVSAMYLTKRRAQQLGIEWIWGRIFSLYGLYEPFGRMLPDLVAKLVKGEDIQLSSCKQYWDYLDAGDAAEALIALAERGKAFNLYNIANGDYKPLKSFVNQAQEIVNPGANITFGENPKPFISLKPDVTKICEQTGWTPKVEFEQGVKGMIGRMK